MKTAAIDTQCHENYAAHDWDGQGDCPQGWKAKGGVTYIITNIPDDVSIDDVVIKATHVIETHNPYFEETIIYGGFVEDGYQSQFVKDQLKYDGEILFADPVIEFDKLTNESIAV